MPRKFRKLKNPRALGRRQQRGMQPLRPIRQARQPRNRNQIGPAVQNTQFGWFGPIATRMANARRWALSLNKANQIVITNGYPLYLMAQTPADVVSNARIAVAGNATKIDAQAAWPAVPADTSLTLTGSKSFGVRVRITNSIQNFKFGTYNVQIMNGATVIGDLRIQANQLPIDIIVLNINNANGQGSIVGVDNVIVKFPLATNPALVSGDILYAESLNARDLGDIANLAGNCACPNPQPVAAADEDIAYDENDEDAYDAINV